MRAARTAAAAVRRPSKRKSSKPYKRQSKTVPFDEMRRLMRVYGSVSCVRKRRRKCGEDGGGGCEDDGTGGCGGEKAESVKRRFYRWFPDLDERFERVDPPAGMVEGGAQPHYRPRYGHETEMAYRAERRREDGEALSEKRARCRRDKRRRVSRAAAAAAPEPLAVGTAAASPALEDCVYVRLNDASAPFNAEAPTGRTLNGVAARPPPMARRVTPPTSDAAGDSDVLLGDVFERLDRSPFDLAASGNGYDVAGVCAEMAGVFDEVERSFYGGTGEALDRLGADAPESAALLPDAVAVGKPNRSRTVTLESTILPTDEAGAGWLVSDATRNSPGDSPAASAMPMAVVLGESASPPKVAGGLVIDATDDSQAPSAEPMAVVLDESASRPSITDASSAGSTTSSSSSHLSWEDGSWDLCCDGEPLAGDPIESLSDVAMPDIDDDEIISSYLMHMIS